MARCELSDDHWKRIEPLLLRPKERRKKGGRPPVDRRMVVNGICWVLRTGAPWRDLPEEFGAWQTAWRLFDKWNCDGTLRRILQSLQGSCLKVGGIDFDLWCIDGSVVRAARCAAGGGKRGIHKNRRTMHWAVLEAVSRQKCTSFATPRDSHCTLN